MGKKLGEIRGNSTCVFYIPVALAFLLLLFSFRFTTQLTPSYGQDFRFFPPELEELQMAVHKCWYSCGYTSDKQEDEHLISQELIDTGMPFRIR